MNNNNHVLPDFELANLEEGDNLIIKDLLQLSFQDRNDIDEEIHGVKNLALNETPELIQTTIEQLSIEIAKIPKKDAFDRSQLLFRNETYVDTDDFRLRFLRCDLYNVKKAAIRMVNFLDLLHELFDTDELLRRPIKFSDLSKTDLRVLRLGFYQPLPFRDRSGRALFANVGKMGFDIDLRTRVSLFVLLVETLAFFQNS